MSKPGPGMGSGSWQRRDAIIGAERKNWKLLRYLEPRDDRKANYFAYARQPV